MTETNTITRTNTRNRVEHTLRVNPDGTPHCPHCGTLMMRVGTCFENSFCPCWWVGANEIDYRQQVVVFIEPADECAFRGRIADEIKAAQSARDAATLVAQQRRAALAGKKAVTRLHFADRGHGIQPRYEKESVTVVIQRCYVKDFGISHGGHVEVMDVTYPDGKTFYVRASQLDRIED